MHSTLPFRVASTGHYFIGGEGWGGGGAGSRRASRLDLECASGIAARVLWEGMAGREAAGCPGLRGQDDVLGAWRWSGPSLSTDSTGCSQGVWAGGESAVSGSNWAVGGGGGAGWCHRGCCSHQCSALPTKVISLWPEMTWPGQRGFQEGTVAEGRGGAGHTGGSCGPHPSGTSLPFHSQGSHTFCSCLPLSIVGVGPGGQVLTSSVTSFPGPGWAQCPRKFVFSEDQPCSVLYHRLRFFSWSLRRWHTWGL